MAQVHDLTNTMPDFYGRVRKAGELRVRAGDTIKSKNGDFIVQSVSTVNGKRMVNLIKSDTIAYKGVKYLMMEMSQLHTLNETVNKDALSSTSSGSDNPVFTANEKYFTVKRNLEDTLEQNKAVKIPEMLIKERQISTKGIPAFNHVASYGTRFVKAEDQKEEKPKNSNPDEKVDKDKPKTTFEGSDHSENDHNIPAVPDPTENLAPRYNSFLYPYGKEKEAVGEKTKDTEGGVSADAEINDTSDIQNG